MTIINNRHAKALFHIEDLQTLMPVMVAHRIGKQAAERGYGIVQGDQFKKIGCRRVAHSAIKLNFSRLTVFINHLLNFLNWRFIHRSCL